MAYYQFTGGFYSSAGVLWEVRIARLGMTSGDTYTGLAFNGSNPLEIELHDAEKWEPVQRSAATLHLVCPTDRLFTCLYTDEPGSVRLTVTRNDSVYWCGTLDPEQYEEPYERVDGYEVLLTFGDFGMLERLPYDGVKFTWTTMADIVSGCISRAKLNGTAAYSISSKFANDGAAVTAGAVKVRTDNFWDEDGEPVSWLGALTAILQPLALRIVQIAGKVYVYDLNALYNATAKAIYWRGASSTLSVDKVYSKVTATLSAYGDNTVMETTISHDDIEYAATPKSAMVYAPGRSGYQGFKAEWGAASNAADMGLTPTSDSRAAYYRQTAIYSGSDDGAIAGLIKLNADKTVAPQFGYHSNPLYVDADGKPSNLTSLLQSGRYWLGKVASAYRLCVKLEILFDARYNPWEQANTDNEEGNYNAQSKRWLICYVPVVIYLDGVDGKRYYYDNGTLPYTTTIPEGYSGSWVEGTTTAWHWSWLTYYDWTERGSKSPCAGWMTNRPGIGLTKAALPDWWQQRGEGEFMPTPPVAGELRIIIGAGIAPLDLDGKIWDGRSTSYAAKVVQGMLTPRWLLYHSLSVDVVDVNGIPVAAEDTEYKLDIKPTLKESLNIDLTCGTDDSQLPTARALLWYGNGVMPDITRGIIDGTAVAAPAEKWLLCTTASQYSGVKNRLTGDADIPLSNTPYTESNQAAGAKFILTGYVVRPLDDAAECTYVELSPETYSPKI